MERVFHDPQLTGVHPSKKSPTKHVTDLDFSNLQKEWVYRPVREEGTFELWGFRTQSSLSPSTLNTVENTGAELWVCHNKDDIR